MNFDKKSTNIRMLKNLFGVKKNIEIKVLGLLLNQDLKILLEYMYVFILVNQIYEKATSKINIKKKNIFSLKIS